MVVVAGTAGLTEKSGEDVVYDSEEDEEEEEDDDEGTEDERELVGSEDDSVSDWNNDVDAMLIAGVGEMG